MPVIRIDDELYKWLQERAVAFEDTPNDVIKRELGLDRFASPQPEKDRGDIPNKPRPATDGVAASSRRVTARTLIRDWDLDTKHGVKQGRYHRDGHFFENLTEFPGALMDPRGYVIFESDEEFRNCEDVSVEIKTNVRGGISHLSGYVLFSAAD